MNLSINNPLSIFAGPCSVDENNIEEIYQIAEMKINGRFTIAGTRVVGLKSRTSLNLKGTGMGIDYQTLVENQNILDKGGRLGDMQTPPTIKIATDLVRKTNMTIATEIMIPLLQIPPMTDHLPDGKTLIWNPAVNQLGWQIAQMAQYAASKNWMVGIKNGKWLGEHAHIANSATHTTATPMEKTWAGLSDYAKAYTTNVVLIHRGVDVPDKQNFRNLPVHEIAKRTKSASKCKLYFDPSHSYGPKMRGDIVTETVNAMKLKFTDDSWLYDGILIEAGTSQTDSEQHISLKELKEMTSQLTEFRTIISTR